MSKIGTVMQVGPRGEVTKKVSEHEGVLELVEEERHKAYSLGKTDGERVGYERALSESDSYMHLLQTIAEKIIEQKRRLLEHLKPEIIAFATKACEQVLRRELKEAGTLIYLIETMLQENSHVFHGEGVKIILSPEDLAMVESHVSRLQSRLEQEGGEIKGLKFTSDPWIHRGDCRIETKGALLNFMLSREFEDLCSKVLLR